MLSELQQKLEDSSRYLNYIETQHVRILTERDELRPKLDEAKEDEELYDSIFVRVIALHNAARSLAKQLQWMKEEHRLLEAEVGSQPTMLKREPESNPSLELCRHAFDVFHRRSSELSKRHGELTEEILVAAYHKQEARFDDLCTEQKRVWQEWQLASMGLEDAREVLLKLEREAEAN